jgi:hypothetical protein
VGMLWITILPSAWITGPENNTPRKSSRPPTTQLPFLSANEPWL